MKRPIRNIFLSNGMQVPAPKWLDVEAAKQLFDQVMEWRGFKKCGEKKCDRCGFVAKSRLLFVVHHRHYRTFGNEGPEDVCFLCHSCHKDIHDRSKVKALTAKDIPFVDPLWEKNLRSLPFNTQSVIEL